MDSGGDPVQVFAKDGKEVLELTSHTGDGDVWLLGLRGAEALVNFVNTVHNENRTK